MRNLHHECAQLYLDFILWLEVTKLANLRTADMNHDIDFRSLESFDVHLYSSNKVPRGVADLSALPDSEDYGWKWDNQHQIYDAIMTTLPPAPESVIEPSVAGCKTGCNINRCKCLKNGGLKCTEMCKCENVEFEDFLNLCDHVIEENTEFESWTIILLSWLFNR